MSVMNGCSCLAPSVGGIGSGFSMTLTRKKHLMKINKLMIMALCFQNTMLFYQLGTVVILSCNKYC